MLLVVTQDDAEFRHWMSDVLTCFVYVAGVDGTFWINGVCLKRHGMDFKEVVIKDSMVDLKSALDSGEVRVF